MGPFDGPFSVNRFMLENQSVGGNTTGWFLFADKKRNRSAVLAA
ncbi:hypothetical protein J2Z83_003298 [Virgibacillus natechei]|uniref:Uncharacterized protein n=1 Tax=Virgibacillus natechei TaxID=1216297 RepID=A0ABS4IJR3_9BACI|nr:hypothetical protein [Virgibacillus natechei]MBP1971159.1 hypothetical protein [Virgibacillus natechei]UZD11906.1 hypothetical protein OLD84_13270 [Virgibacillus natechei]